MSDYIKREDVLDRIITYGKAHEYDDNPCIVYACANLERQMNAIPAADVVERPRWIPVTERLPKVHEEVLVYLWDSQVPYIACIDRDGMWETNDFYIGVEDTPKAWMPLPQPPKEVDT